MLSTIFIGVGSNLDPEHHVALALAALRTQLEIEGSSTFYWSAPLKRPEQPRFLNGVWRARTARSPREVKFEVLRVIEQDLGRRRKVDRHAARTIDLDLLMHGNCHLKDPDLTLPDPEIPLRAFLWHPLQELDAPLQGFEGLASEAREVELEVAVQVTRNLRQTLSQPPEVNG